MIVTRGFGIPRLTRTRFFRAGTVMALIGRGTIPRLPAFRYYIPPILDSEISQTWASSTVSSVSEGLAVGVSFPGNFAEFVLIKNLQAFAVELDDALVAEFRQ